LEVITFVFAGLNFVIAISLFATECSLSWVANQKNYDGNKQTSGNVVDYLVH